MERFFRAILIGPEGIISCKMVPTKNQHVSLARQTELSEERNDNPVSMWNLDGIPLREFMTHQAFKQQQICQCLDGAVRIKNPSII